MSTVDKGNQLLSLDFLNPGSSVSFNKLLLDIIPPGIYSGGLLSISGGLPVVAPMTTFLVTNNAVSHTDPNVVGVRVETTTPYTVAEWTPALPVIIIRLNWANVTNNYADILAVSAPQAGDLIIGYVPDTNPANISYTNATYPRTVVIRYADTIPLTQGVASSPTGGTATNLSGANTIINAFNEVFSRLRDLSGVQNAGVTTRLLDLGTGTAKLNAQTFQIDAIFDFVGTANDVVATDSIMAALTKFYNALKDLNGVLPSSVGNRLMNWGVAGDAVNASQLPANVTTAFGVGGTVNAPVATDSTQSVLQKIIGAIADLSGVANGAVKKRHIDFTNTAAKDFTVGSIITQALQDLGTVSIAAADAVDTALGKILAGSAAIATALHNLGLTVSSHSSTLSTLNQYQPLLPVGSLIMYDNAGWADGGFDGVTNLATGVGGTFPGWYACTAANHAKDNRIPNLEGSFIRAISPIDRATKITNSIPLNSGTDQITLVAANLPPHTHGYMDRVNAGNWEGNVNGGNAGGSDLARTTDTGNGLNSQPFSVASAIPQYAAIFIKRIV